MLHRCQRATSRTLAAVAAPPLTVALAPAAVFRTPPATRTASISSVATRWSTSAAAGSSAAPSAPAADASPRVPSSFYVLPPLSTRVQQLLQGFSELVPIHVAWGEQDGFGHVNNACYTRWSEIARIHWITQLANTSVEGVDQSSVRSAVHSFMSGRGVGPILKSVFINFQSPVVFPDCVVAGSRLHSVSRDRFSLTHRLVSLAQERSVAESEGVIVTFEYASQKKADIPLILRQAIDAFLVRQAAADAQAPMVKPPRSSTNYEPPTVTCAPAKQ